MSILGRGPPRLGLLVFEEALSLSCSKVTYAKKVNYFNSLLR